MPETSIWSRTLFRVRINLAHILAVVALILALAYGTGAWLGMDYANKYAKGSYQIAMYEFCLSEVSCSSYLLRITLPVVTIR